MTEKKDKVVQLLNPEIKEQQLGIKKIKIISVYPLTYFDQKIIGEQVVEYFKSNQLNEKASDMDHLGELLHVLEENLPLLIKKCTDMTEEAFMSAVTGGQLVDFLTKIIEVNFLNPIMKGTKVFANMGNVYGMNQLSQPSVSNTDINSEISQIPIKKED